MHRYLITFSTTILIFMLMTSIITWKINPYDYWNTERIAGINLYKPALGRHLPSAKQRQALRLRPRTILAGNSRVDVGFDPLSSAWEQTMLPVHNFGLPGRSASDVTKHLKIVLSIHQPRTIIFAVDFFDFRLRISDSSHRSETSKLISKIKFYSKILFSINALTDSFFTIFEQQDKFPASWSKEGYNSLAAYEELVAFEGHKAIFDQRELKNLKTLLDPDRSFIKPMHLNPEIQALESFLEEYSTDQTDIIMIIHPYHADILTAFRLLDLWDDFLNWKRWLTTLTAETRIRLIDFSNYSKPTQEQAPGAGDTTTRLTYFWEAGHYKAALGDIIISDLQATKPMYGTQLTAETIDETLQQLDQAALDYELNNPKTIQRIRALIDRLR